MLFCTGDTHGDFNRFTKRAFPEQETIGRNDYVLICGDFGGLWYGTNLDDMALDFLESRPFTTLFVDGNHENYDLLLTLPVEQWNGGKIHRLRPHVLHLMRGQVFNIDGHTFFTMGGASCHDVQDGILDRADPEFDIKYYTTCAAVTAASVSTTKAGGRRSCPAMRNTPRPGKTSKEPVTKWTSSSPTALRRVLRTSSANPHTYMTA